MCLLFQTKSECLFWPLPGPLLFIYLKVSLSLNFMLLLFCTKKNSIFVIVRMYDAYDIQNCYNKEITLGIFFIKYNSMEVHF